MDVQTDLKFYSELTSAYTLCWIQQLIYICGTTQEKTVIRVSHKMRLKPACSATESSQNIEFSLLANFDVILSNKGITKALSSLRACAGWSAPLLFTNPQRQVFSR